MSTLMNEFGCLTSKRKMTLFPNNCKTQCVFFLIVELKSKLLNDWHIFKIRKKLFLYLPYKLSYIFLVIIL